MYFAFFSSVYVIPLKYFNLKYYIICNFVHKSDSNKNYLLNHDANKILNSFHIRNVID